MPDVTGPVPPDATTPEEVEAPTTRLEDPATAAPDAPVEAPVPPADPTYPLPDPLWRNAPGPGCAKVDPIVIADAVTKTFGGLTAVDVEHLEIPRHAITALIGPNGAGKTTFFNLLTGFDKPDRGYWEFNGKGIAGVPAWKISRMGQVRTFQLTKAFGGLTVLDSMKLGARDQRGEHFWSALVPPSWRTQEREIEERALHLLEEFKLYEKRNDMAVSMSGGQRKLLEMARALMSAPQLVMLDEPMAGVNPALTQSLLGHVVRLKEQGMSVVFVEHDMHMVQAIADWVVVMAEGRIVAEGVPAEVMRDQVVVDAYLGANMDRDLHEVVEDIRAEYAASHPTGGDQHE
ncbi:MAG: ATP-binding cassette domain-containing protein [Pauljensenia sp.]